MLNHEQEIRERFPYPEFRPHQLEAIDAVVTALKDSDTRFFALDGPPGCFTGETKISLLDGTERTLDSFTKGEKFWVYGCKPDGTVLPVEATALGETKKVNELVEVTLDNGASERCTSHHFWMLRDGTYKEAKDLQSGDSLMPKLGENHKVVSTNFIHLDTPLPVYDIYSPSTSNFALSSGVFVHNSGKSIIAKTVATFFPRVFFVTTQKLLQHQFANEFNDPSVNVIYSSDNYQCVYPGFTCGNGNCRLSSKRHDICTYKLAKRTALSSHIAVMNYAYLLNEHNCSVTGSSKFDKCSLLILDEGHNVEDELRNFLTITIDSEQLRELDLGIFDFEYKPENINITYISKFIIKSAKKISQWLDSVEDRVASLAELEPTTIQATDRKFLEKYENAYTLRKSYGRFMQYHDRVHYLIADARAEKSFLMDSNEVNILLKPVEIQPFAHEVLYSIGEKVLLMSGTFLDKQMVAKNSGILPGTLDYRSLPSHFPKENRKIVFYPASKMSNGVIHQNIDKICGKISEILEKHPSVNGIIHAPSYEVADAIFKMDKTKRIIHHYSFNVNEKLEEFLKDTTGKFLISPRMYEGYDFKDDQSRVQIVVKIPWLSLSDVVTKYKADQDFTYYSYRTVVKLLQCYGRSTRSAEDYSVTYILDSDFLRFMQQNLRFFPQYVRDALV